MQPVLVVDDDPHIRTLICRLLGTHGFTTVVAVNGQDALEHMREEKPCVVILDLQMPVVDGTEFRRRQLADPELADVPVICVTGHYAGTEALRSTGVQCFSKPLAFPVLLQAVHSICRGDAQAGQLPHG